MCEPFTRCGPQSRSREDGESSAMKTTRLLLKSDHPHHIYWRGCRTVILNEGKVDIKIHNAMDLSYTWARGTPFFQQDCHRLTSIQWSGSKLDVLTAFLPKAVTGLWEKNSWESISEQLLIPALYHTVWGQCGWWREKPKSWFLCLRVF